MLPPADDSRFLKACRCERADVTPVWFMRQAGRYLAEYRALRQKHSLLELCRRPDLAAEVTLQPVERLGVDAAILFADILLPFEPLGLGLTFADGDGPRITRPIRDAAQVLELPPVDPAQDLGYVIEAARLAAQALPKDVPLIGFAGAPFTLASYAIEGGSTRSFVHTKRFMYAEPRAWHALMERLAELAGRFLAAQARAGARALQLFDSWVGCLSPADYAAYVFPHSQRALALARQSGTPVIHFGTGTATFLADFARAGGDVIGVDSHPSRRRLGAGRVRARDSGEPRPRRAARATPVARKARARRARAGGRGRAPGAHLQSRARRAP